MNILIMVGGIVFIFSLLKNTSIGRKLRLRDLDFIHIIMIVSFTIITINFFTGNDILGMDFISVGSSNSTTNDTIDTINDELAFCKSHGYEKYKYTIAEDGVNYLKCYTTYDISGESITEFDYFEGW